jgi:ABC-type multidrug transport system ATPase subunit
MSNHSTARSSISVHAQGLDPASRRNLWDVVKAGRAGRGIILTTHSMQEAEVLCDRLGIFVDGRLVCIGPPKEVAARYGKYLVRTARTLAEYCG